MVCAFSGMEALNQLDNDDTIEVVVLDVIMPGMDGIETIKKLKVFFDFLYRYSLWISPPFFALGVASLIYFIKNVIRLRVEKQILTVPLAAQQ